MEALKEFLTTPSRMTVFRNLKRVNYISSYSHQGKYYSLPQLAQYDELGIWHYREVSFSQQGTLKQTLIHLIDQSDQGWTASELTQRLQVKVEDGLLDLVRNDRIVRKKCSGHYVYFAKATHLGKKQELTRQDRLGVIDSKQMHPDVLLNELKAALIIFYSTLNEKQRRLYAGFESLKAGRGGDERIAEILDLNPKTVARGRKELLSQKTNVDGIRQKGGGRKRIKKKPRNHRKNRRPDEI
jgi:hypothetical protein